MSTKREDLKKSEGQWVMELTAECPHCGEENNLMEEDEWWVMFGSSPQSRDNINHVVKCSECKKRFLIDKTNW